MLHRRYDAFASIKLALQLWLYGWSTNKYHAIGVEYVAFRSANTHH